MILSAPAGYIPEIKTCYKCGAEFDSCGTKRLCPTCRAPKKRAERVRAVELTNRERQLVALVMIGKQNKEIAWDLKLTEGTIKEYLMQIYRKTGMKNRTELTRMVHLRETAELRGRIAELEAAAYPA